MDGQRLLRVEEAARLLGLGRSKVYELVARGELGSITVGRSRRIPRSVLEAWIERSVREQCGPEATTSRHATGAR